MAPRTAAPPVDPPAQLLTLDDAALAAGVHRETIRRWIAKGVVPAYRVGPRLVRIDARELERATHRHRIGAQPIGGAAR